jgi:hypothetical protein
VPFNPGLAACAKGAIVRIDWQRIGWVGVASRKGAEEFRAGDSEIAEYLVALSRYGLISKLANA